MPFMYALTILYPVSIYFFIMAMHIMHIRAVPIGSSTIAATPAMMVIILLFWRGETLGSKFPVLGSVMPRLFVVKEEPQLPKTENSTNFDAVNYIQKAGSWHRLRIGKRVWGNIKF